MTDESRTRQREAGRVPVAERKESRLAKFTDVHDGFVGVTEAELREAHARDLANEGVEGVHFERTWLDPESGKVFCRSTGPSKEAVQRVHEKSVHRTVEVYELPVEVE